MVGARRVRISHRARPDAAPEGDNGSPWYFSGAPDRRWDNDDLYTLDRLTGKDFEVVDTRSLPRP